MSTEALKFFVNNNIYLKSLIINKTLLNKFFHINSLVVCKEILLKFLVSNCQVVEYEGNYLNITPYKIYWLIKLYEVLIGSIPFDKLLQNIIIVLINNSTVDNCAEFTHLCEDDIWNFLNTLGILNEVFINNRSNNIDMYKRNQRINFLCPTEFNLKYEIDLSTIINDLYAKIITEHKHVLQNLITHPNYDSKKNLLNYMTAFIY